VHPAAASKPLEAFVAFPSGWTPTILIVDDDRNTRRILETRLRALGCRVIEAEDGIQGLSAARQERPDLILLDWMMPGMAGPEMCAAIKADDKLKSTQIVILTARGGITSLVKAFESGANDFLSKPYEAEELLARIGAGLQARALYRQVEEANEQLSQACTRLMQHQEMMQQDLECAADFVRSTLPVPGTVVPDLRLAWRFAPSFGLGGDLFNVCPIGERLLGLYIMDVAGHGIGAALQAVSVSMVLQAGCRVSSEEGSPLGLSWRAANPALLLDHLNGIIPFREDEHFTIWAGVWDDKARTLTYASAGHPPPVLLRANGAIERMGNPSLPLGAWPRSAGHNLSTTLGEQDRLVLFSDGLYEAFNSEGDLWGTDRLVEACRRSLGEGLESALDLIIGEVQAWQGAENFHDDVAIVALQVEAAAKSIHEPGN
jgi:sigma-B regulation protein RsbU (phosphoserine phosphatase)